MSVISLTNQKGGCAKSTTTVHLAWWLTQKRKKTTIVVDADAQRSSSIWLESLEAEIPFEVISSPDDLLDRIPDLTAKCDYLLVDGPAGLSEATRAILFRSDLALVPCQPTGVDLRSASDAIRLIHQAQSVRKGEPSAALFVSRATKGTKLLEEAIALLKSSDIPVLNTVIHQKQAIADTFGQQAVIWEMPGRAATESAREFERLFTEVMELLPCPAEKT